MKIKKISTEKNNNNLNNHRPKNFDEFIGQEEIKKILITGIESAIKRNKPLGHILFSGESGYGKTSLSNIIAHQLGVNIKIITGYAFNKPAELISVLNSLEKGDVLFIDEIHRLKPNLEEVLYTAMEDYAIDMIMPDGANIRVPLNEFTLIGATTKLESLTNPLKNRFIYKFHFTEYNDTEKSKIIIRYLTINEISFDNLILEDICKNLISIPREICNFSIQLRDYLLIKNNGKLILDKKTWSNFKQWAKLANGGLNHIHQKYISILEELGGGPVGLKTISLRLGLNEKAVENDIETQLLKIGMITKTSKGRCLNNIYKIN